MVAHVWSPYRGEPRALILKTRGSGQLVGGYSADLAMAAVLYHGGMNAQALQMGMQALGGSASMAARGWCSASLWRWSGVLYSGVCRSELPEEPLTMSSRIDKPGAALRTRQKCASRRGVEAIHES
eukprot:CAMPEP_0117511084 /NCGR_PEP_ID=MMETSP0784-20121206/28324_1 /TAXON_ID=39447 /ORGANISM="" /LENGTH=125 /DNA_ID=CAMNT_0005306743 /DNA_START=658 /DNA_END=1035 /DNA_ORIENTATION=-